MKFSTTRLTPVFVNIHLSEMKIQENVFLNATNMNSSTTILINVNVKSHSLEMDMENVS